MHPESNIRKIQVHRILAAFHLFTPVIILFFTENGLSLTQAALLQSVYTAGVLLIRRPAAKLSDRYGRRIALAISGALLFASVSALSLSTQFIQFLTAQILFAAGVSLEAGSSKALLRETLQDADETGRYGEIWSKTSTYGLVSASLACLIGGLIGQESLRLVFLAMTPIYLLMIPVSLSLRSPEAERELTAETPRLSEILKLEDHSLSDLARSSGEATLKSGYFLYQPFLAGIGASIGLIGVAFSAMTLTSAIGSKLAQRGKIVSGPISAVIGATGFTSLGSLGAPAAGLVGTQALARGALGSASAGKGSRRSLSRLIFIPLFPLTAASTQYFGAETVFLGLAVFLGVISLALVFKGKDQ